MKNLLRILAFVLSHWQLLTLVLLTIGIFLIPAMFWGSLYAVGGDDGRFYYIYPLEYLKYFSFNIISNNTLGGNMGYLPVSYSAPTIFVLYLLKIFFPSFNTQLIAYGTILATGFLFTYLFLREVIPSKNAYVFWSRILASIFYIFSVYITKTFFQHQLISMYSIMVLPVCLYLFVLGLNRNAIKFILASSLFYSVFSSTLYGLPWLLPSIFTMIPFLFYIQKSHTKFFIKAILLFIVFTLLCNSYWIVHYIIPVISRSGGDVFTDHLLSSTYREQNDAAIAAIARLNSPVNQIINHLRTSWMDREGVSIQESIGVVYLLVILYAGSMLRLVKKEARKIYMVGVLGLCIALFFVTPNFGELNLKIFQFLNNHIPFFVMFRNMYDKFALATAFQYAFALYIALYIFSEARMNARYKYSLVIVLMLITILKAYPYVFIKYTDNTYSTRISGALNPEFHELMDYIRTMNTTSRFLWYPMTYPGYIVIRDTVGQNHFYSGLSMMQILAQKSDIAGYYGIQTPSNPKLNATLYESIKQQDFVSVGKKLQQQNIGYIIENKERPPLSSLKFLDENGFMSSQSSEYLMAITGKKIKDFGSSYTLYAIHEDYTSPTVYLTDTLSDPESKRTSVEYLKRSDGSYDISIDRNTSGQYLVLLEPYNPLWVMNVRMGSKRVRVDTRPSRINDFGMAWQLRPEQLISSYPDAVQKNSDGSYTMNIEIRFLPGLYTMPALLLSVVIGIVGILYILF